MTKSPRHTKRGARPTFTQPARVDCYICGTPLEVWPHLSAELRVLSQRLRCPNCGEAHSLTLHVDVRSTKGPTR